MCSISRAEGTLHFQRKHHTRSAHHVPLAEHIVEKRKRPHIRGLFFFLAPRTGLEPVTSPTVSDSQARANIVGATRQSHSRLGRSLAHFRYSLLYAFDFKKQPFRLFFLVNYQLRAHKVRAQSVYRWKLIMMSRANLSEKQKEKTTLCVIFSFWLPGQGLNL